MHPCYTVFYCMIHDQGALVRGALRGQPPLAVARACCGRNAGGGCDFLHFGVLRLVDGRADAVDCTAAAQPYNTFGGGWALWMYASVVYNPDGNALALEAPLRRYFGA